MKRKTTLYITTIIQLAYLLCILLNFLCIWMFNIGVPYAYPFAITGGILILFCPIEVFCLIRNLTFWVKDIKQNSRKQNIVKFAYVCLFFIILCLVKIVLYIYGNNNLVGIV